MKKKTSRTRDAKLFGPQSYDRGTCIVVARMDESSQNFITTQL